VVDKQWSSKKEQPQATSKVATNSTEPEKSTASDEEPNEIVKALKFSPPLFVAWGVGYMSDTLLILTISVMLMPLGRDKLVEVLGGQGAGRKWFGAPTTTSKPGAGGKGSNTPPEPSLLDVFKVPMSVWLPPFAMVAMFRSDSDLEFLLTLGTVYSVIVAGQAVMKKLGLDPESRRKLEPEPKRKKGKSS